MRYLLTHLYVPLLLLSLSSCEEAASNRKMGTGRDRTRDELNPTSDKAISSQIHRERGAPILSSSEEISKMATGNLSDRLYRTIPSIEKDDEGSRKNIFFLDDLGRPDVICGIGTKFTGVSARITECAQKNGSRATWDGKTNGAAGESTWVLVSFNGAGKEIWQDTKTGLTWSSPRERDGKTTFDWCRASGNNESETPDNSVDCSDLAEGESVCAGEDFGETNSQIKWRLPTRNDFLQADINGLRFVLPRKEEALWTGTIRAGSPGRSEGWVYNLKDGTLTYSHLSTAKSVRCIGAPVR